MSEKLADTMQGRIVTSVPEGPCPPQGMEYGILEGHHFSGISRFLRQFDGRKVRIEVYIEDEGPAVQTGSPYLSTRTA